MTMPANAPAVVRLEAVSHRYGDAQAVSEISLNVPAGKMVSFIGPDGAGKSTLLDLISGARKVQQGKVEVLDGSMLSSRHRTRVCRRIAYMPQGLGKNLYQEITVRENLHFFGKLFGQGLREREARIDRLAAATGLSPFLERPAGKLSGGMKQKLGLCCALIHDPDLLILDEPTTGVDPLSRRQFWTLIRELRKDRPDMSVIFSTAYMDEAEQCDWIAAVDAGRILAAGTLSELYAATGKTVLEDVFNALQSGSGAPQAEPLVIPAFKDDQGEPIIRARNLTCRFGDFTAVSDVSFDIPKGEIFGFLGSNGCGKTTTMRMLTGLLAPTEGVAEIYGSPIDANDLLTRRRVGFMSQAFSLYSELTVRQNIILHARLYHLDQPNERTEALISQFDLTDHADQQAGDLPLGMRQRLSLAAAVVHDPELLILDEPTSGVDPQARDAFWRILADLSRRQKVTIFVSTHFMNEAMRCDRISLMHAGRVLVCDTPQNVLKQSGEDGLEKAFVTFIEGAIEATPGAKQEADPVPQVHDAKPVRRNPVFDSWRRILAWSYCETLSLARDPVRLAFAFFGSLILLLIFSYGTSSDVTNLSFAVYDQDQTAESRDYISNFQGSRYFTEMPPLNSSQQVDARLKANDITLALEIPAGFGREVKTDANWQVSAWIDGANTQRAATIENYVQQAHSTWASKTFGAADNGNLSILNRHRYNPTNESIYAMGPSIPALLLMLFLAILMAVSVTREKEIGTISNFYVTPTKRLEFLLGKFLPYLAIGLMNFAVMTATVVFVFGVPLKGSGLALTIAALLYSAAALGFGLLVSTFTTNQVSAVFVAAVLALLPTIQFSGMLQPVSTLEGSARIMGSLWPTTYYMQMSVGAFTKGLSFSSMIPQLLIMAIFGPVFVLISAFFLKKQEA
jgi:ribosome-dependent ATPase